MYPSVRILFLLCFFMPLSLQANASYSLADLEALAQEGNYEEFLKHARDVRPSERQDTWKSMVSRMALGLGQEILGRSEVSTRHFQQMEELYRWPVLRSDSTFRLRRSEIGLRYLGNCMKNEPPCWQQLKLFWESDKSDSDTAVKLAELTLGAPRSPLPIWTFLEAAVQTPLSEFYCKKDFVIAAVWSKLEIDYVQAAPEGNFLNKIDQTVHPDCLPALNRAAHQRLHAPQTPIDRELAFQILKAQGKTGQTMEDFFHVVYLLERPSKGELFNYAWNRLAQLGKSGQRREEVLKALKKLDPLPDELLASLDELKKKVVFYHFKANFPEYIDYYFDQCLKFYGGKEIFPKGNPTIHCQQLIDTGLGATLLDDFKIQQYQAVKNI
jgi:hypothetical protein